MDKFKQVNNEIHHIINKWEVILNGLSHQTITTYKNKQNRTIKQILGHLIDSATNNIHRIIHLQYQNTPYRFPDYACNGNNDRWISIQNYQEAAWCNLIEHWKYSNFHLCHIINNVNESMLDNSWISGTEEQVTLEDMILDYIVHMKLHINEIQYLIQQNIENTDLV